MVQTNVTTVEHSDKRLSLLLSLVFLTVSLYSVSHHEMWRDELQAWMIALSSNSFSELFLNIKYEGHPSLWFIILYLVKHLTQNPAAMQVVHVIIATVSVYIFTRYAPLTKTQRILFVFGYFTFYEYNIISRNYAVGVLFLFSFMALYKKRVLENNYIVLSIILFFLCRCNVFATVLAIACALYCAIELFYQRNEWIKSFKKRTEVIVSGAVFFIGLVIALRVMAPEPDTSLYSPLHLPHNFDEIVADSTAMVSNLWNAYVPIPRFETMFWESNAVSYLPLRPFERYMIRFVVSLAVFVIIVAAFIRKPKVLFFYLFGTGFVFAFYFVVATRLRYIGHLYLIFISSLWLYKQTQGMVEFKKEYLNKLSIFSEKLLTKYIVTVVLLANCIAGISANVLDIIFPFSSSYAAAAFIQNNPGTANLPIAGSFDYIISPIAGYLNRSVYYLDSSRVGTFIIWDKKSKPWTAEDLITITKKEGKNLVLVTSYPLQKNIMDLLHIIELRSFSWGAAYDEIYWIYLVKYGS
ncbi:MAG: hypothetical protein HQK88_17120 [Nitrospirae bacterium]|nr:hypothetical protein [Nitrospirota bacterium]MBF0534526.1 hypothetical protein [Nitrospirota bacterium]MBF0618523.1 hypothetical protein [Nitrospirota bacterium]